MILHDYGSGIHKGDIVLHTYMASKKIKSHCNLHLRHFVNFKLFSFFSKYLICQRCTSSIFVLLQLTLPIFCQLDRREKSRPFFREIVVPQFYRNDLKNNSKEKQVFFSIFCFWTAHFFQVNSKFFLNRNFSSIHIYELFCLFKN